MSDLKEQIESFEFDESEKRTNDPDPIRVTNIGDDETMEVFVNDGKKPLSEAEVKAQVLSEIAEDKKIQQVDLDDFVVKEVVSAVAIEPIVLFIKFDHQKESEDPIGVPGFYDKENFLFFQLDGSPVPCKGFDGKFRDFLLRKMASPDAGVV
jgi:hypothetical protein